MEVLVLGAPVQTPEEIRDIPTGKFISKERQPTTKAAHGIGGQGRRSFHDFTSLYTVKTEAVGLIILLK
ncbi:hypothetical protein PENSUB_4759 [Penicillium subrubescens]|jgi:hypothetical protein|uniref:Uncharacterized protein n=1 Tax=Penicillium subrubescens TaxID=1316194 RepID=A0A1Q5UBH4_9EURO|nr:hypothetical protein PENSUB_4759 [Penicillium subrubescens]